MDGKFSTICIFHLPSLQTPPWGRGGEGLCNILFQKEKRGTLALLCDIPPVQSASNPLIQPLDLPHIGGSSSSMEPLKDLLYRPFPRCRGRIPCWGNGYIQFLSPLEIPSSALRTLAAGRVRSTFITLSQSGWRTRPNDPEYDYRTPMGNLT